MQTSKSFFNEVYATLLEANMLIDECREEYNHIKPDSSISYQSPLQVFERAEANAGYYTGYEVTDIM